MAYINWDAFEDEMTRFLRNGDILTVAERNVTTDTDDTFSGDGAETAFVINRNNVKNIRTISVDASPLVYGQDYTYNKNYNDAGTIKCQINFTSAPASGTDNITLSYDYGSDNIFPGYSKRKIKQKPSAKSQLGMDSDPNRRHRTRRSSSTHIRS